MSATPSKLDRRILMWSAAVFFIASWLAPVIPVNYSLEPLWSYISEFVRCIREGYYFTATGYCVLLIFLACVTFLLSTSLGWLVQRVILFVRGRPPEKKDDHEISA